MFSKKFAFCLFISYPDTRTWTGWHLRKTVLWGNVTWSTITPQCRRILSGRKFVHVRIVVSAIFDFMTERKIGERRNSNPKGRFEGLPVFISSLSPPPTRSIWFTPFPPLFGKLQHGDFWSKNIHAPEENACTAGYVYNGKTKQKE